MTQHPPRRRATRLFQRALLATLATPLAVPAQPALRDAYQLEAATSDVATPSPRVRPAERGTPARTSVVDTLAFAHAALRRSQIELVPVLERMGARSEDELVAQPMLLGVAAELRRARAGANVLHLLDRTASSLDAMCAEAAGARQRSCRAMTIQLTAARAHVRAGRKPEARRALSSLAKHADDAVLSKAFLPWEGSVIGETARYAIDRI